MMGVCQILDSLSVNKSTVQPCYKIFSRCKLSENIVNTKPTNRFQFACKFLCRLKYSKRGRSNDVRITLCRVEAIINITSIQYHGLYHPKGRFESASRKCV